MAWGYQKQSQEEDSPFKKSKYNAAIAQLYRLDKLWQDSQRHSRQRDFLAWNMDLDAIWRELSEDVKQNSDDEKNFRLFNLRLAAAGLFEKEPNNFEVSANSQVLVLGEKTVSKSAMIYHILNLKEIFLRRLQNTQGKSAAYEDSIEDYMDS